MFGKAKKSLGQNFLNSEGALLSMCEAANVSTTDYVLEIGPGRGALTKKLLATGATVIAIEKDADLIQPLNELFEQEIKSEKLILIEGDVLDDATQRVVTKHIANNPYKLVANIPYYITGLLIECFLTTESQPESMTILVQKEVAERIVARDKKESVLSISVKAYGAPTYVQTVKRGSFTPAPNVDSAILHISNINKEKFVAHDVTESRFFEILKAGFAHKRKHLGSNLAHFITLEKLEHCGIKKESRAETLQTEQWFCLSSI